MANNINGGAPNAIVAKVTVSFADAGINQTNTSKIFLVDVNLKSYVPGRAINGISGFVAGKGYWMQALQDMDLTAYVAPPLSDVVLVQLAAPAAMSVSRVDADSLAIAWTAGAGESGQAFILDRATNVGFTTGVANGIYSGLTPSYQDNGLGADTVYYYRVRGTKAGFTDSAKTAASGTTEAGDGLTFLTFATKSGTFVESPSHVFTGDANAYMIADQTLAASTDGLIQVDIPTSSAEVFGFGLDTDGANSYFNTGGDLWDYYAFVYLGYYYYAGTTEGSGTDSTIAYANGDKMRLKRTGSSIALEKSSNAGVSWSTIHIYATGSSAKLYAKIAVSPANATAVITNPKGLNLTI